ncbi:hypothetical protein Pmani_038780 [Petrolisthes manimaculis]|uniref:Uncharacterized protein n=1 Tax=Petrolisthes manimaculis TaxID=1843537 RepID=A0AAE1NDZ9_9EUCA|nr:hypothetical protein Pmani_038780 [Petrolisthes manimaculis]
MIKELHCIWIGTHLAQLTPNSVSKQPDLPDFLERRAGGVSFPMQMRRSSAQRKQLEAKLFISLTGGP